MRALLSAALVLTALGLGAQLVTTRNTHISELSPAPAVPDRDGVAAPTGWPLPYVRRDELGRPTCRRNVLEIGCPHP
jgi:hypothetical protein